MLGKRKLALIEAAREKLKLSEDDFGRMLTVAGGAGRPEDLTRTGFDLVMDQCTSLGFRDPRRPVLSIATIAALARMFAEVGLTPYEVKTLLRGRGTVGELHDLDGVGLINVLVYLSTRNADVEGFVARRSSVTGKQLALLHVAKAAIDLDATEYATLLQCCGGVNSAADLDRRGFDLVMAGLRYRGFEAGGMLSAAQSPAFGERPGFASSAQVGLIRELWAEWSGSADEAGLVTWLERSYRVSALRFVTAGTASNAITALKAMKRRLAERPKVSA